ncbi:LamG domain-containing protein [Fibrella sp. HMF5335]|uniref:LamG domain-containing protein n=1 Tax=Fibrella rubiginis TaxID=2817060 RepID=A0A939K1I1_9BACT|nr:LamG domain-containing protein [Fibrella rubiginis]MBO0935274.1 LamG domain-containing protein [Fibrella rubiginis]
MEKLSVSIQELKTYTLCSVLSVMLSCERWNLPPGTDNLTNGLIAYYSLNGNTLDLSGNALNGQLINGATYGPDRKETVQSALQLDGIDDYFEIPDNAKLRPDSISISLWLKARKVLTANDSTRHIYNKDDYATHEKQQYSAFISKSRLPNPPGRCCEFNVDVNNDGFCVVEQPIQNRMIHYAPTFELNQWYHFVSVFSGQTLKLYLNGELKMAQRELTANPIDRCVGGNLRFGAQAAYDVNNFDGLMDEIRIYNRALTQAEINALYRQ